MNFQKILKLQVAAKLDPVKTERRLFAFFSRPPEQRNASP